MTPSVLYILGTPDGVWSRRLGVGATSLQPGAAVSSGPLGVWLDGLARNRPALLRSTWTVDEAKALDQALAEEPHPAAGIFAQRVSEAWPALLRHHRSRAAFLVYIEHPAIGLCAALSEKRLTDPRRWLAEWRDTARTLLRLAQAHPDAAVFLDAVEAGAQPQAAMGLLRARFGDQVVDGVRPAGSASGTHDESEPLNRLLARSLIAEESGTLALHDELQACCHPLQPGVPAPTSVLKVDVAEAFRGVAELRHRDEAAQARIVELGQQMAIAASAHDAALQSAVRDYREALAAHAELASHLALVQEELLQRQSSWKRTEDRLAADIDALQSALAEQKQAHAGDCARLSLQLAQARQELELVYKDRQRSAARLAESQAELASLRTQALAERERTVGLESSIAALTEAARTRALEYKTLEAQLRSEQVAVEQSRAELAAARESLGAVQAELARSHKQQASAAAVSAVEVARCGAEHGERLKVVEQENALLLQQLHQVQEELEAYYIESLQRPSIGSAAQGDAKAGQMLSMSELPTAPHFGLDFRFSQVRLRGRELGLAHVRLIEHHGNPGLVFFAGEGASAQPLLGWTTNGQEDGTAFLRLVPGDVTCQPLLDAMSSTDWQALQAWLDLIDAGLAHSAGARPLQRPWRSVVRRLRTLLLEQAPRLRYAAVRVQPMVDAEMPTVALHFEGIHWGARSLDQIEVHWRPTGSRSGLTFVGGDDKVLPLAACPPRWVDDKTCSLTLALGEAAPAALKREQWLSLSAPDHAFLMALIRAWPVEALDAAAALIGRPCDTPDQLLADVRRASGRIAELRVRGAAAAVRGALRRVVRRDPVRT